MAFQVTTLIADLSLEGDDRPVDVARIDPAARLLRARVYRRPDDGRDLWDVDWASAVVARAGVARASGPAGPVRVILSVA